jgi:hypothetical protein
VRERLRVLSQVARKQADPLLDRILAALQSRFQLALAPRPAKDSGGGSLPAHEGGGPGART